MAKKTYKELIEENEELHRSLKNKEAKCDDLINNAWINNELAEARGKLEIYDRWFSFMEKWFAGEKGEENGNYNSNY